MADFGRLHLLPGESLLCTKCKRWVRNPASVDIVIEEKYTIEIICDECSKKGG